MQMSNINQTKFAQRLNFFVDLKKPKFKITVKNSIKHFKFLITVKTKLNNSRFPVFSQSLFSSVQTHCNRLRIKERKVNKSYCGKSKYRFTSIFSTNIMINTHSRVSRQTIFNTSSRKKMILNKASERICNDSEWKMDSEVSRRRTRSRWSSDNKRTFFHHHHTQLMTLLSTFYITFFVVVPFAKKWCKQYGIDCLAKKSHFINHKTNLGKTRGSKLLCKLAQTAHSR